MSHVGHYAVELSKRWASARRECADPACRVQRRRWPGRDCGIRLHGVWYCSPQCFENATGRSLSRMLAESAPCIPVRHRIPLGLMLLSRGELTQAQLHAALEAQRFAGHGRIGEWLKKLGFVNETQVMAGLGLQWACPVLPDARLDPESAGMVPYPLMELFHMVPVRFVAARKTLYVAFSEDVHYPVLYALEQMLECRTEACLVPEPMFEGLLANLQGQIAWPDFVFRAPLQPAEVARITTGYAVKVGARNVRIVPVSGSLWLRLEGGPSITNLLFTPREASAVGRWALDLDRTAS